MVQVWSRSFICVEVLEYLEPNKQYPTLVQYEDRKPHTNTSDECNRFPWLMKFSRFLHKDKSETLSSKYVLPDYPTMQK